MSCFTDLQTALDELRDMIGDETDAASIPAAVATLDDGAVVALIQAASALVRGGESLRIAGSGAVAWRSARDRGHTGLAQNRGHRSPVTFFQEITGTTRGHADVRTARRDPPWAGRASRRRHDRESYQRCGCRRENHCPRA